MVVDRFFWFCLKYWLHVLALVVVYGLFGHGHLVMMVLVEVELHDAFSFVVLTVEAIRW